jgi:hypothetical protein
MKRIAASVLVYGVLLSANVHAMPTFPSEIQSYLHLSYTPQCTLCHASLSGGGPVVTPFGEAMQAAGLTMSGGSTLTNALDTLAKNKTDSNGNGISDIDELKAGNNPNPDKTPVQYGCGAKIAPGNPVGWQIPMFALVAMVLFRRRSTLGSKRASHW